MREATGLAGTMVILGLRGNAPRRDGAQHKVFRNQGHAGAEKMARPAAGGTGAATPPSSSPRRLIPVPCARLSGALSLTRACPELAERERARAWAPPRRPHAAQVRRLEGLRNPEQGPTPERRLTVHPGRQDLQRAPQRRQSDRHHPEHRAHAARPRSRRRGRTTTAKAGQNPHRLSGPGPAALRARGTAEGVAGVPGPAQRHPRPRQKRRPGRGSRART